MNEIQRLYKPPTKKRLTEHELVLLDEELETFREITPPSEQLPKEANTVNQTKWMISRGAKDKNGAIIITNYTSARRNTTADCDPILAEQLEQDFNQWNYWKWGKQVKAEGRMEAYEKMREESGKLFTA